MDRPIEASKRPTVQIRPGSGWQILNLREIVQYWDLLLTLAERDLKLRYRQTALGAFWVIAQPLMAAGILAFVFGKLAKMPTDGVPHVVFALTGMVAWNAFVTTLARAGSSLLGNTALVSKVYFPRVILPLSCVFSTLVDFLVSMVLLLVIMAAFRLVPGPGVLLLPLWLLLIVTLGLGIGLMQSAMVVKYRAVINVVGVMITFLMYASPVAYAVSAVPPHLQLVYHINPMVALLEGFRWSLLGRGAVSWGFAAYSVVATVTVFLLGARVFKKMERQFADII